MIPPRFPHQDVSLRFMEPLERVFDASDPGTAKTRVQVDDFTGRRFATTRSGCALVICLKSLMRTVWEADFSQFSPGMRVSVAPAGRREEAFAAEADVYVTNTDAVRWLAKQPPKFFAKFDTLIVDEASAFKHPTSQRSKALAKIRKYFKYRRMLTGTPNANTILDIWHPMFVLDDGRRLGTSYFHFRSQVCDPQQTGPMPNMVKWVDRPGAEAAVSSLIKDITIRHKLEECLGMPEKIERTLPFDLSVRQLKAYQQMERSELAILRSGKTITAVNAASALTKLLQIASGAVYDENGHYHLVDTERYELVADLCAERRHTLVFFQWKHQRDELAKQLTAQGLTYAVLDGSIADRRRAEIVDCFQQGLYRVLLAQPQSAAHGLTLTRATTTIWASPTYNLEHFLQGNRRIYRAGQKQRTETISIVARGTVEEQVVKRLSEKNAAQLDLLNLLQERA